MRVVYLKRCGDADNLHVSVAQKPTPECGEVLIKVAAAAVNPADTKWRSGMFEHFAPMQFPQILGYDVAGWIENGNENFPHGSRVAALLDPMVKGGYAEYVVCVASNVASIPDSLPFEVAAALPTAGLTGVQMIEDVLAAKADDTVLVTGAVGAVGTCAMWAARNRGVRIIAAVRAAQREDALALGASDIIVLGEDEWSGAPFDAVADTLGGPLVAELCRHVRSDGRICTVATTPIDPTGLPVSPVFYALRPDGAMLARIAAAAAEGSLIVPVASTLGFEEAAKAHLLVERGGNRGKIVLVP